MSYKYSKGSTVQGDIKAADDTQRDTMIDFEEDRIDLQTSGSVRLRVENDNTTITNTLHLSGSNIEALRIAKGGDDYKQIVFETDGVDTANIHLSNAENLVLQNETNGKEIQFWVNPNAGSSVQALTIAESGLVGIGTDAPDYELDVAGNIGLDQFIYHNGDADTLIKFDDNQITFKAGNLSFMNVEKKSSAPHEVTINDGSNNIDFVVKGNGSNQGNPGMKFDASANRLGINGVGTPDCELHVDGDIKATGGVNAKLRHINTAKFSSTDTSQRYVRWDAAGSNGSPGVNNKFVAPCDGSLVSVTIRSTLAANGTNIAFHKASNGTANLNTTATETVGIDIASNNTTYQATFSGSTFSAGEILGISINPSSTPNDVNITCVWLFDWNS